MPLQSRRSDSKRSILFSEWGVQICEDWGFLNGGTFHILSSQLCLEDMPDGATWQTGQVTAKLLYQKSAPAAFPGGVLCHRGAGDKRPLVPLGLPRD